jgi:PRTRC genetic system protein C
MARIFIYDNREFPDPDPKMTIEEVRQSMVNFFPELANADTSGPTVTPGQPHHRKGLN